MSFVPWPKDRFVRRLEGKGHELRRRLLLGDQERLGTRALINTFDDIQMVSLLDVGPEFSEQLAILEREASAWSAIAYREPGGPWLVSWNPWHARTRARVSIMEEVSHIRLQHAPTRLVACPNTGLPLRTFTKSKEKEAYGVAGAALVPYNGLVKTLGRGMGVDEVAAQYDVSPALVRMRAQITRLSYRSTA